MRRLHRWLRQWAARLLAEHSSPGKLAAAVVLGAIVGTTPLFGLHFPICVALAWLLRLNKITVYAAANISVPPMVPLLGFASVEVGERLLHGRWLPLGLADFRGASLEGIVARFFLDWLAGAVVVGGAIGAVMALVVFLVARRRQRLAADPIWRAIREASARFRGLPRKLRFYAWFKYRLDPCYRRIAALVPEEGLTVDLGTGMGMLPLVLVLLGGGRRATGVDWDEEKVAAGRRAAAGLDGVTLEQGDLREFAIPRCRTIALVDVLHYYAPEAQREILARCAAALDEQGQILVRDGDARAKTGGRWTRLLEAIAVRVGWNRGEGATRFRPISAVEDDLRALGLLVDSSAASGRLHPGNVLVRARRPAEAQPG